MPDFQELNSLIKQQSSFNEALKMNLVESAFLNQLKDSKKTTIITEEVFTENLIETPDFSEVDQLKKQNDELKFYKNKYRHLFYNDQEKKIMSLYDLKIIKQEVIMEILTNPESLNQYLEKIKNDYNKISEASKNRRKDYIKDQMFQLKLLTNLLTKDPIIKNSANANLNWLTAKLNNLEE
jgi:hypothetical protein